MDLIKQLIQNKQNKDDIETLVVDILYGIIDPRVNLAQTKE